MKRRRVPRIPLGVFAVTVTAFAISLGELGLTYRLGKSTRDLYDTTIYVRHGRAVYTRQHLLSSVITMPAAPNWRNGFGFSRRRFPITSPAAGRVVLSEHLAIPLYPLPLLAGLWLVWSIRRALRSRPDHACSKCGYDLRATPDRCPECGSVPARA